MPFRFQDKREAEKLSSLLIKGQRWLFASQLARAETAFCTVRDKVSARKDGNNYFRVLKRDAELGLWAVAYYRGQAEAGGYKAITGTAIPEDENVRTFLGNVFFNKGAVCDEALAIYGALLRQNQSLALKLAPLAAQLQLSDSSLHFLSHLKEILPQKPELVKQLCSWYVQLSEWDRASELAQILLARDSKNRFALRCLGYIEERRQNWPKSKLYYRRVKDWISLLRVCIADQDFDTAERILKRLNASKDWNRREVAVLSGWVDYRRGRIEKALEIWEAAGVLQPTQSDSLSALIEALSRLRQDASEAFRLLAQIRNDSDPFLQAALSLAKNAQGSANPQFSQLPTVVRPLVAAPDLAVSLQNGHTPDLNQYPEIDTPEWNRLVAICSAQRGDYEQALYHLAHTEDQSGLRQTVTELAVVDWLSKGEFNAVTDLIARHPDVELPEPLVDTLVNHLWGASRFSELITLLLAQHDVSTVAHHHLALAYTHLLAQNIETRDDTPARTLFKRLKVQSIDTATSVPELLSLFALGHWAVVLSDGDYLDRWAEQRLRVFGSSSAPNATENLRSHVTKTFLNWMNRQLVDVVDTDSDDFQYLAALLPIEVERAMAVRHILQAAVKQKKPLPPAIRQLISPVLVQSYGHHDAGATLLRVMPELMLSPHEARITSQAFSALNRPYVFIESGLFDRAIASLQRVYKQEPDNNEVRDLLLYALQRGANQALENGQWDTSMEIAELGLQLKPDNRDLRDLYARAAIGWAKDRLESRDFESAIRKLRDVRKKVVSENAELNALLCDALVDRAVVIHNDRNNLNLALELANEAIGIMPDHIRARNLLAMIYHNRAVAALEAEQAASACNYAREALKYEKDPATYRVLALALSQLNAWESAIDAAVKALELDNSDISYSLAFRLRMTFAYNLANQGQYARAINLVSTLLNCPVPSDMAPTEPCRFLSALCTDYGVQLYRQRRVGDAQQQWRIAIQLDPSNSAARQNLRASGVWL